MQLQSSGGVGEPSWAITFDIRGARVNKHEETKRDGRDTKRIQVEKLMVLCSLQDDVDDMYDTLEEMEDEVKELKKLVSDLRVQVANKRDK